MAITAPFHGLMTELHILDDITTVPDSTTQVAEISSVGTLELTANIIEYNSYGSMYKQKLVGQKDSGTVSIGINWVAGETSHTALKAAYDNSGLLLFRINWISGSETTYCAFYGYVASYSIDTPVEDVVSANIDIAISGSVGFDGVEPQTSGGAWTPAPAILYDLSNSTSLNKTFYYGTEDGSCKGMSFNDVGTKWYMYGTTGKMYEYDLSTAYDVSTATYNGVYSVVTLGTGLSDISWKPDGTTLYGLEYSTRKLHTFATSTPWDITALYYVSGWTIPTAQGSQNIRFTFNDAGTMLFMLDRTYNSLFSYNLSTAWAVTTATYTGDSLALHPFLFVYDIYSDILDGLKFSASGHKCFVTNYNTSGTSTKNAVFEIDLATAWDINTATYSGVNVSIVPTYGTTSDLLFNGDGSQLYVLYRSQDQVVTFSSGA